MAYFHVKLYHWLVGGGKKSQKFECHNLDKPFFLFSPVIHKIESFTFPTHLKAMQSPENFWFRPPPPSATALSLSLSYFLFLPFSSNDRCYFFFVSLYTHSVLAKEAIPLFNSFSGTQFRPLSVATEFLVPPCRCSSFQFGFENGCSVLFFRDRFVWFPRKCGENKREELSRSSEIVSVFGELGSFSFSVIAWKLELTLFCFFGSWYFVFVFVLFFVFGCKYVIVKSSSPFFWNLGSKDWFLLRC